MLFSALSLIWNGNWPPFAAETGTAQEQKYLSPRKAAQLRTALRGLSDNTNSAGCRSTLRCLPECGNISVHTRPLRISGFLFYLL